MFDATENLKQYRDFGIYEWNSIDGEVSTVLFVIADREDPQKMSVSEHDVEYER